MRSYHAKVRDLTLKRKNTAYNNLAEEHADTLRVAHVVTWRWEAGVDADAGRPAFSKRELRNVLQHPVIGYHVKTFIDDEVGSVEDFFKTSANS